MNWSIRIDGAHLNSGDGVTFFWTARAENEIVCGAWFPVNGSDLKTTAERVIIARGFHVKQITCEAWFVGTDNFGVRLKEIK